MTDRNEITSRMMTERERQLNIPGLEYDVKNSPNDWITIIGRYLFEGVQRGADKPSKLAFEDSMIKAGAVIIAALEYAEHMKKHDRLS